MKTVNQYFDDLKDKTGSDYATAKALGIGKSSLSMIRTRKQMADETAIKVAELLEIDPSEVLLAAAMARSEGNVKTAWRELAKKAGIAANVLLFVGLASGIGEYRSGGLYPHNEPIIYIMRSYMKEASKKAIGTVFALVLLLTTWSRKNGSAQEVELLPHSA